ncbi:cytochrome P450 [Aspergillus campestris IBT 28561]|uniref:Cytochrome P450 n=1 Tax=Aspergillus campestris (strain IBT 28561) TaxID=1392248 RepID=A0A2I1D402_ASPC2|nr:cytochrome P450 [Aspergillus campestris IBT 28561]PKY04603.1 cytochrome P450 [Aspergillus campestris IBT 28561]
MGIPSIIPSTPSNPSNPLAILGFILLASTTTTILYIIYNIYLHPLRSFPGPFANSATPLPLFRSILRGTLPHDAKRLHAQYGPAVRIAPNEVTFTDPAAWKEIYGVRPGKPQRPKDLRHVSVGPNHIPSMLRADDRTHARYRRALAPGFSEGSLQRQEVIVRGYIDLLVERLRAATAAGEEGSATVDISRWYNYTTFDIIGDLAFGDSFGCLQNSRYHFWVQVLYSHFHNAAWANVLRRIPWGEKLMRWIIPRKVFEEKQAQNQMTGEKVHARIEKGDNERADFLSHVLKQPVEKGMSEDELISNAYVLIIAGSETTATLLSGVTYYLLTVPGVLETLQKEVRGSFRCEEEITWSAVNQLKYTLAVLNEGLRMYPPAPFGFPRIVEEGDFICGRWVPGGTSVGVPMLATHRSPRNFKNPDEFIPDRYMGDPAYEDDKRHAVQAFSLGPRNCLGQNLAYAEMRLILARMIWNFDMELADDSRDWIDQKSFVVWAKGSLHVKLTPVQHGH